MKVNIGPFEGLIKSKEALRELTFNALYGESPRAVGLGIVGYEIFKENTCCFFIIQHADLY